MESLGQLIKFHLSMCLKLVCILILCMLLDISSFDARKLNPSVINLALDVFG